MVSAIVFHGGTMKSFLIVIPLLFITYCASTPTIVKKKEPEKKDVCVEGDCINGQGTMQYADGRKYTGGWKDGKWHLKGLLTSDGIMKNGNWNQGNEIGSIEILYGDGPAELLTEKSKYTAINGRQCPLVQYDYSRKTELAIGDCTTWQRHFYLSVPGHFTGTTNYHKQYDCLISSRLGKFKGQAIHGVPFVIDNLIEMIIYEGPLKPYSPQSTFVQYQPHGFGTLSLLDEFSNVIIKYTGQFNEGYVHGKGVLTKYNRNGDVIETVTGWWKEGKFLGEN